MVYIFIMTDFDASKLRKKYDIHSREEYQSLLLCIVEDIQNVLAGQSLRFQIKYRVKEFGGYLKKLCGAGAQGMKMESITDMLGIRIVCPFLEDLEKVENILTTSFIIREIDKKQNSRSFREFGYDATHLLLDLQGCTVRHPLPQVDLVCEIQLRTILQDAWAEVEHELIYKSDWSIPTYQIRRKLAALNANLTLSDIVFQEIREFQREVVQKQNKRRAVSRNPVGQLSKNDVHSGLLDEIDDAKTHGNLEKLILQALTAHSEEDFVKAIRLYSRALKMPGTEAVRSILLNHRGMARLALGENEMSQADFLSSIEADSTNYRAWYNLGIVYRSYKNLDGALNAFSKSLELNPLFIESGMQRIYLLMEMGEHHKAKIALTDLRRFNPDAPELCLLQEEMDDSTKAGDK